MKFTFPAFSFSLTLLSISLHCSGQSTPGLKEADSLYLIKQWAAAKIKYGNYLGDTSTNSLTWNRLGFCNQNLGLYPDALFDYNKSLANNPSVRVKSSAMSRMAMIYSLTNKPGEAAEWLVKAAMNGYSNLEELDTLPAFQNLRSFEKFKNTRQKVYGIIYPCSNEPRNRDFDFWIGDWNCYQTGTQYLSGTSHVEVIAGGCALLENYISIQSYSGKSFNFYDTATGKWEQDWIGSGGPGDRQRFFHGEFKNGQMHFDYETINAEGKKVKGNFIFYYINQDSVRQYQDIIDETGKTTTIVYDLTYLRKK